MLYLTRSKQQHKKVASLSLSVPLLFSENSVPEVTVYDISNVHQRGKYNCNVTKDELKMKVLHL